MPTRATAPSARPRATMVDETLPGESTCAAATHRAGGRAGPSGNAGPRASTGGTLTSSPTLARQAIADPPPLPAPDATARRKTKTPSALLSPPNGAVLRPSTGPSTRATSIPGPTMPLAASTIHAPIRPAASPARRTQCRRRGRPPLQGRSQRTAVIVVEVPPDGTVGRRAHPVARPAAALRTMTSLWQIIKVSGAWVGF